jgi:hypothetical protein
MICIHFAHIKSSFFFLVLLGGPGSKKGRIVDDLVSSYGFHYLSSDNTILEELPQKVKNVAQLSNTKDLQEFLKVCVVHPSSL